MSLDNPHLKRGGWTLNVTKRPRIKYNIQRWPGSPYAVLNYFCCAWFKFRWVTIVIKALWLVEAWVWKVYKLAIPKILKRCTSNSTNMNDRFHHSRLAVWHLKRIPNRLLPTLSVNYIFISLAHWTHQKQERHHPLSRLHNSGVEINVIWKDDRPEDIQTPVIFSKNEAIKQNSNFTLFSRKSWAQGPNCNRKAFTKCCLLQMRRILKVTMAIRGERETWLPATGIELAVRMLHICVYKRPIDHYDSMKLKLTMKRRHKD